MKINTPTPVNSVTRNPVLIGGVSGGAMAMLVGLFLDVLVSYGLPITPQLQTFLTAVFTVLAPIITAIVARRFVTPLIDPRNDDGDPLVPLLPPGDPV